MRGRRSVQKDGRCKEEKTRRTYVSLDQGMTRGEVVSAYESGEVRPKLTLSTLPHPSKTKYSSIRSGS